MDVCSFDRRQLTHVANLQAEAERRLASAKREAPTPARLPSAKRSRAGVISSDVRCDVAGATRDNADMCLPGKPVARANVIVCWRQEEGDLSDFIASDEEEEEERPKAKKANVNRRHINISDSDDD